MAKLEYLILHCSDSKWGSMAEIRRWHLGQGWRDAGYHFGISNGWIRPSLHIPDMDGSLEVGRYWDGKQVISSNSIGAHALGYNDKSLGIVLIGIDKFTVPQFWKAKGLFEWLLRYSGLNVYDAVRGHGEVQPGRACPNVDMDWFRDVLFKDTLHHPESYPFEIDKYWMKLR